MLGGDDNDDIVDVDVADGDEDVGLRCMSDDMQMCTGASRYPARVAREVLSVLRSHFSGNFAELEHREGPRHSPGARITPRELLLLLLHPHVRRRRR